MRYHHLYYLSAVINSTYLSARFRLLSVIFVEREWSLPNMDTVVLANFWLHILKSFLALCVSCTTYIIAILKECSFCLFLRETDGLEK